MGFNSGFKGLNTYHCHIKIFALGYNTTISTVFRYIGRSLLLAVMMFYDND